MTLKGAIKGSFKAKSAVTATCHCGAVKVHVRRAPRTLTQCNCSICRRYGARWAYYQPSSVRIECAPSALQGYVWGNKVRTYYRCRTCGAATHYKSNKQRASAVLAVNGNNFDIEVIEAARIRQFDGARTWKYLD